MRAGTSRHAAAPRSLQKLPDASPAFSLTKAHPLNKASFLPPSTIPIISARSRRRRRTVIPPRPLSPTWKCNSATLKSHCDARIGVAQQAVDNCTIRAPFPGIVVSKDAQVGEMVSPNSAGGGFTRTGIATIVDMNSNEIEVDVSESYIARVQPGQPVMASLDAYPDWQIPSKVRTVIPTADRQKATVKVRISFLKLDSRILPDMGVKVAFLEENKPAAKGKEKDKGPQAVALIPKSAVRSDSSASFVYLLRDGKVERRAVSLGIDRGTEVAVLAGVTPGDSVVVKGPENLRDGEKVEIRQ